MKWDWVPVVLAACALGEAAIVVTVVVFLLRELMS